MTESDDQKPIETKPSAEAEELQRAANSFHDYAVAFVDLLGQQQAIAE